MKLVMFEDDRVVYLEPLSSTRPVFDLRCGHSSLGDKIIAATGATDCVGYVRGYLADVTKEAHPDFAVNDAGIMKGNDLLLVNGRLLLKDFELPLDGDEQIAFKKVDEGDEADKAQFQKCGWDWKQPVVYARVKASTLESCDAEAGRQLLEQLAEKLPRVEVEATLINWPWDLVHHNPEMLTRDFRAKGQSGFEGNVHETAQVLGSPDDIFVGKGADVHPFVVFDASEGPIYIDEEVVIHPFTRVEGPCFVGKKSWLLGTKLREGCSIGEVCRVGGEVEESIFHAYSNKYHDGFIGHAYVGEWVNLGALTTNSDLKNDYTDVDLYIQGQLVTSRDMKVGSFFGDHAKTGLSSLMNTGTIVGVMCNILPAGGMLPKEIPSFAAMFNGKMSRGLGFNKLMATARYAMGRRKCELSDAMVAVFEHIQQDTDARRRELIKADRKKRK